MFLALIKDAGTNTPPIPREDIGTLRLELNRLQALNEPRGRILRGGDIASASSLLIGDNDYYHITGTMEVSSLTPRLPGTVVWLEFDAILNLRHSANLILQDGVDFQTHPGDVLTFISEGDGVWREIGRQLASVVVDKYTDKEAVEATAEALTDSDDVEWVYEDGEITGWLSYPLPSAGTVGNVVRDDGKSFVSSNIGVPKLIYTTADQTRTTTTLINDTYLFQNINAYEKWSFEIWLATSTPAAGGLKTAIDIPTGATMRSVGLVIPDGTASIQGSNTATDAGNLINMTASIVGGIMSGVVENGALAGKIQLMTAQNAASGTTTIQKYSKMVCTRIS